MGDINIEHRTQTVFHNLEKEFLISNLF